ncbi:MAG: hypothetical protein RMI45_01110 [Ignisphaera sp.]|nr:hypothetical protein [Ignisphaera sp.]MDW8084826.1 hypothetical protein [Ignisphaera sp.]
MKVLGDVALELMHNMCRFFLFWGEGSFRLAYSYKDPSCREAVNVLTSFIPTRLICMEMNSSPHL